jgi:hypothetical protein
MKNTLLLLGILLSVITTTFCQEKKVFVVKAGEAANEVIPFNEVYTYPAFKVGLVHFRSGDVSQGRLNYNVLTAEMDFINDKGDTLALADEPLVKLIVIGKDSFFFNSGYFELVASSKEFKLGKRTLFTTAKIEKTGVFDQPVPAGVDTYSGFSNGNHVNKLVVKQNLTLVKETAYYFGNKNNEFLPASRKNLKRVFAKQEKKIDDYLAVNTVDFRKEEDLVKIIQYLQSL